ncbi:hypothetical protein S83_029959 [Arachis hypogaea]
MGTLCLLDHWLWAGTTSINFSLAQLLQTEETKRSDINGPKGIISSVGISVVVGFCYILGITFAVTDIPYLLSEDNDAGGYAIAQIFYMSFKKRYGSGFGGIMCLVIVAIATFFCGMGQLPATHGWLMLSQEMGPCPCHHCGIKLIRRRFL